MVWGVGFVGECVLTESILEWRTRWIFGVFGFFYFHGVHFLGKGVFGVTVVINSIEEGGITLLGRNVSLPKLGFARNLGRVRDCY